MPYSLGAAHPALSGSGQFAIASPIGLKIAIAGIPASLGHDGLTPTKYFRLGSVLPGDANGWHSRIVLEYAAQLVRPIDADCTLLRYDLVAGATMAITELLDVTQPNWLKQPWDRTPAQIVRQSEVSLGASANRTVAWTYTVPANKRLIVAHAEAWTYHKTASTTISFVQCQVEVGSTALVYVADRQLAAGQPVRDSYAGGLLVLNAGDVINGNYTATFTGGEFIIGVAFAGTLFDV